MCEVDRAGLGVVPRQRCAIVQASQEVSCCQRIPCRIAIFTGEVCPDETGRSINRSLTALATAH